MPIRQFMRLNELRGLHPRTAHLLTKDAAYEGTQYDHLAPWSPFYALIDDCMCYLPEEQRSPKVQIGLVRDKVDTLLQKISGEDKWATVKVVDPEAATDEESADDEDDDELVQAKADFDALKPRTNTIRPLKDLSLKGSAVLGFTVDKGNANPAIVTLPTQWCDAVFNSQVSGEKATGYSAWLLNHVDGIGPFVDAQHEVTGKPALLAVEDADPLDVAYVTMQWRRDEDVLDGEGHKRTKTTWLRRDYLRDVIVEFEPLVVHENAGSIHDFKPLLPLRPHRWGLLPLVWIRPEGTEPGELDGDPLISRQFMTMAEAADYTASRRDTAYAYNAFPRMALLDAKLEGEFQANPREGTNRDFAAGDPGAFLRLESRRQGTSADVKLLETSGAAIEKGIEHGDQLRKDASQLSGVQEIGREDGAGALSGTAVQRLQEPTTAVVKSNRSVVEEAWGLLWTKLSSVTSRHVGTALDWLWPPAVTSTAEDMQEIATALIIARSGPFITHKTAAILFGTAIGLDDPEAEWRAIEEEGPLMDTSAPPGPPAPVPPGGDDDGGDDGDNDTP